MCLIYPLCLQNEQYGLSFINLHSPPEDTGNGDGDAKKTTVTSPSVSNPVSYKIIMIDAEGMIRFSFFATEPFLSFFFSTLNDQLEKLYQTLEKIVLSGHSNISQWVKKNSGCALFSNPLFFFF